MNAKLEIPCEIQKGLVFTTIYRVVGKCKKDGSLAVIHYFLNREDAYNDKELSAKLFTSLYSVVFVDSQILWL